MIIATGNPPVGHMSDVSGPEDWKQKVLARDGHACVSCESTRRVAVCYVVPPEAGGKLRVANGASVCRGCRVATERSRSLSPRISNKTPINFLISSSLHKSVHEYARSSGFGTVSAMLRSMISSFVDNPELYEDLGNWQDDGSDVKVNGWVDGAQYNLFRAICQSRGVSYTDTLKALLLVAVDENSTES